MKHNKLVITFVYFAMILCISGFYFFSPLSVKASVPPMDSEQAESPVSRPESLYESPRYESRLEQIMATLPADISQDDFYCLAQAIYFEARGEPFEGQIAVAYVVLNRVKDSRYPDQICEVIFQNENRRHQCQFSFACDGRSDKPHNPAAWTMAREIAGHVLINAQSDVTSRSTHYHAAYVEPAWAKYLQPMLQVGQHIFYREEL